MTFHFFDARITIERCRKHGRRNRRVAVAIPVRPLLYSAPRPSALARAVRNTAAAIGIFVAAYVLCVGFAVGVVALAKIICR
jgi:hypothetical protein